MSQGKDPAEVYRALGVTPVITASGSTTVYGGSKLRPEVMEAMNQASGVMVELGDLNRAAGEIIAKLTGAEAGLVSSGAAGGLVLQAAAASIRSARPHRIPAPCGPRTPLPPL